jgi:hypothetical protein
MLFIPLWRLWLMTKPPNKMNDNIPTDKSSNFFMQFSVLSANGIKYIDNG